MARDGPDRMPTLSVDPVRRGVRMPGTEVPRETPGALPKELPSIRPRPDFDEP